MHIINKDKIAEIKDMLNFEYTEENEKISKQLSSLSIKDMFTPFTI